MCLCAQSRPTLCDSMDSSPPDSSVHGFFQTRTLSGLSFPPPGDFPLQVLNLCLLHLLLWQVDSWHWASATVSPHFLSNYWPQQSGQLFAGCHESWNHGVELVSLGSVITCHVTSGVPPTSVVVPWDGFRGQVSVTSPLSRHCTAECSKWEGWINLYSIEFVSNTN